MSSGSPKKREELLAELEREVRQTNVLGEFFFRAIADRVGLNAIDLQVVNILDMTGPATAGELAEMTGVTTGAITGLINRLERVGLVRRERDPEDRRRVIVRLVPNEEFMRKAGPIFDSIGRSWAGLVSDYDDEQLAFLVDFLRRSNAMTRAEIYKLRGGEGGEFVSPLGGVERGRLVFAAGASRVTIHADPDLEELYRAHFEGPSPEVREKGGTVTIRYPRRFRPMEWRRRSGRVTLNAGIPWEIEVRGGASELVADLAVLKLSSLEIKGGASKVEVSLPEPEGKVPVRISGGASGITLSRPREAAARMVVKGGVSRLDFDGQRLGAVGGTLRLQSTGYGGSGDHYEIVLSGGASRLDVVTR